MALEGIQPIMSIPVKMNYEENHNSHLYLCCKDHHVLIRVLFKYDESLCFQHPLGNELVLALAYCDPVKSYIHEYN